MDIFKWLKANIWLILVIFLSLYLGRTLLSPAHFYTHDDIQIFRVNEFITCLKDGQIPCRWSSELGKGYGYPLFIFYPPAIYILASTIYFLGGIPISFALNLSSFITFPLAAFAMYRLILVVTARKDLGGVISALYLLLPYHAVNVFVRGVYAENLVWALAPLLFAEVYQLIKFQKSFFTLSALLSIVLLTHNISAMILFPLLAIWGISLILADWAKRKGKVLSAVLAGVLALGLASFFVIPALVEKNLVQTESMLTGYYSYIVHFPSLKQIFLSNFWGYGGSNWGTEDGLSFALGQVQWLTLVIAGLLVLVYNRQKIKPILLHPITLSLTTSIGMLLFLANPRSTPVWEFVQPLQYIQFPWRLVGMLGLLTLLLTGFFLSKIPKHHALGLGFLAVFASLLLFGNYFRPDKYDNLIDQDFIEGSQAVNQKQDHLFDYLPKTVSKVPEGIREELIVGNPQVEYTVVKTASNLVEINLDSKVEQELTVAIFAYPGWELLVNNNQTMFKPHEESGLITFQAPEDESKIILSFKDTPLRTVANLISSLALLILVIGIVFSYKKSKVE